MARPTKQTAELVDELCALLRQGVLIQPACARVGIDDSTFRLWRKRDHEFFAKVTRARAEGEIALFQRAIGGDEKGESNGPAKCAQWALERSHPNRYAARLNVKLEEGLEWMLAKAESVLDEESYAKLVEALTNDDGLEQEALSELQDGQIH